jgi:hypothetical protein
MMLVQRASDLNKDNINEIVHLSGVTQGRNWILCNASDKLHLEDMRYVMSLKPNMTLCNPSNMPLLCPPFELLYHPKSLQIYVEMGGEFKDFFLRCYFFHYLKSPNLVASMKIMLEHGARIPRNCKEPKWIQTLYDLIEKRLQHCRTICSILCAMRKWNASRSPLLNRTRRDVLSIIINMVWNTRFQQDWGIRKSERLKRTK